MNRGTTESEIQALLQRFGEILEVAIMRDPSGESKGLQQFRCSLSGILFDPLHARVSPD
jgi:hypothetical protein